MENANKNVLITIVAVLAVLILIGAYVLFQSKPALPTPPAPIATSTAATTTSPTVTTDTTHAAGTAVISTTEGGNGEFGVIADTSNVRVGGTLPKIVVNLPVNANGKTLVVALKPAADKAGIPQDILLATTIDTTGDTYNVSGLKIGTTSNATTGAKTAVTPGIYQLEVVLWDRNPFMTGGIYGNNAGNNATAVVTSMFTVASAQ